MKADAFSRLHAPEETPENPEPVLPPKLFVCPIHWSLDEELATASASEPHKECAMAKTSRHLPIGKLLLLPVPHCPWSQLGMDFIMDLPPSDGNTYVLMVVDRFSKAWCLIPLKGLPTAMETAEILFNHVFRNFGLPEDPNLFPEYGGPSSPSWV